MLGRMTSPNRVAVLGLGRMGMAIATRLAGQGQDVIGWTRSGRPADSFPTVTDVNDAMAEAGIVLLALFDGRACRQVLGQVRGRLRPDTIVLNTSTIGPAEASALARELGPRYVHAPVLGSVPDVASGALLILAAAGQEAFAQVHPVLHALGTVRHIDDAATAAALKLVANSSLAGAVLALRDSLQQADALSLPRAQALDILELGQLGGLVARKRAFLAGRPATAPATAEFTIGALAKDMTLLAAASGSPLRSAAELADTPAEHEADIAAAAVAPPVEDAVLQPLHAYISGHATGDPSHFRTAFLPTAHIEGIRDSAFVSWTLDQYCALFHGQPAPDEADRSRRIDSVDVHGTVATASMTLRHGTDSFTDIFLLVHSDTGWRIANKAYHRRLVSTPPARVSTPPARPGSALWKFRQRAVRLNGPSCFRGAFRWLCHVAGSAATGRSGRLRGGVLWRSGLAGGGATLMLPSAAARNACRAVNGTATKAAPGFLGVAQPRDRPVQSREGQGSDDRTIVTVAGADGISGHARGRRRPGTNRGRAQGGFR